MNKKYLILGLILLISFSSAISLNNPSIPLNSDMQNTIFSNQVTSNGNMIANGNMVSNANFNANGNITANNGIILSTTATRPACSSINRGQLWIVQGGIGNADLLNVCAKNALDQYGWRLVSLT